MYMFFAERIISTAFKKDAVEDLALVQSGVCGCNALKGGHARTDRLADLPLKLLISVKSQQCGKADNGRFGYSRLRAEDRSRHICGLVVVRDYVFSNAAVSL